MTLRQLRLGFTWGGVYGEKGRQVGKQNQGNVAVLISAPIIEREDKMQVYPRGKGVRRLRGGRVWRKMRSGNEFGRIGLMGMGERTAEIDGRYVEEGKKSRQKRKRVGRKNGWKEREARRFYDYKCKIIFENVLKCKKGNENLGKHWSFVGFSIFDFFFNFFYFSFLKIWMVYVFFLEFFFGTLFYLNKGWVWVANLGICASFRFAVCRKDCGFDLMFIFGFFANAQIVKGRRIW